MKLVGGLVQRAVRRHVSLKPVIPAHAGIQTNNLNPVSLDSGFRRNDEKSKRVDGLPQRGTMFLTARP